MFETCLDRRFWKFQTVRERSKRTFWKVLECAYDSDRINQCPSTNQAAIVLTGQSTSAGRTKHIDAHHHFVRQRVRMGDVGFTFISTERMAADALTKAVQPAKLALCKQLIGMCS